MVERLRGAATRFPTFMSAGAAGDAALTQAGVRRQRRGAARARLHRRLRPDADVTSGPGDPTIGSRVRVVATRRSVAEQVVAAAAGFAEPGVLPVIKHFPGHGSRARRQPPRRCPVQTQVARASSTASDLVPFRAAIEAGLPAVMVGHLDVRADRPAGAPRRCRARWSPGCCATSSASAAWSSPTRSRWRASPAAATRGVRPSRRSAPAPTSC